MIILFPVSWTWSERGRDALDCRYGGTWMRNSPITIGASEVVSLLLWLPAPFTRARRVMGPVPSDCDERGVCRCGCGESSDPLPVVAR